MSTSTATHPLFSVMSAALTAKGYTTDIGEYITAGGTSETRMYVSHKNRAIRKSAAKVTLGEDGFPVVAKGFADSRIADVKTICALVTLVACKMA